MRYTMNWRAGLARGWLGLSLLWLIACGLEWRAAGQCAAERQLSLIAALQTANDDAGVRRVYVEQAAGRACDARARRATQWAWLGPVLLAYSLAAGVWTVQGFRAVRAARAADADA